MSTPISTTLAQVQMLEWLSDPLSRQLILPALAAGAAVVVMCSVLSVLVIVKRLAFVGQGVAHSAFGGVGIAALFAALTGASWAGQGSLFELAVVIAFCVLAALGMTGVADKKAVREDTGIGLFLVGSMALGALLIEVARTLAARLGHPVGSRSWESVLFGSILNANWSDAAAAGVIALLVLAVLILLRRPMLFYVSDESSARAFGVPTPMMRAVLMILLAVATVVAMRLTGVVLSSALLILPGAAALKLSARLGTVLLLALAAGLASLFIGLTISLQFNVQAGPCIVLTLTAMFAAALPVAHFRRTA